MGDVGILRYSIEKFRTLVPKHLARFCAQPPASSVPRSFGAVRAGVLV